MNKKISLFAAAAALVLAAGTAQAQVTLRVEAGAAFTSNLSLKSNSATGRFADDLSTPVTGFAVGYRYLPWLRSELSLSYVYPADFGATSGADNLRVSGRVSALRGFASVFAEPVEAFAPGLLGPIKPYIGAGIGAARVDFRAIRIDDQLRNNPTFDVDSKTRTNFAWHASAGVGYDLTNRFTVDLGYRYVDQGKLRSGSSANNTLVSTTIDPLRDKLQTHEVVLGVAYKF